MRVTEDKQIERREIGAQTHRPIDRFKRFFGPAKKHQAEPAGRQGQRAGIQRKSLVTESERLVVLFGDQCEPGHRGIGFGLGVIERQ